MGVYYEELAYFLADNARTLSVLLPNKVKHFAQSTEQKSKMDRLDARLLCRLLCRLGLVRALPAWQPPTPALCQLRPPCASCARCPANGSVSPSRPPGSKRNAVPTSFVISRMHAPWPG